MSRGKLGVALSLSLLFASSALAVPTNVTLNKPATLSGVFGVLRPASGWASNPVDPAGSIDDGVFRPESTVWNEGSIWWDASVAGSERNTITIDLQGPYAITGIITQADNNDYYNIEYFDPLLGSWRELGAWGPTCCFGLTTRPSGDQVTPYGINFNASAIRLSAFGGDDFFAYSEFQAFGEPIPEPATAALMAAGLAGLVRRRRAR
jgi:hypothetical protein